MEEKYQIFARKYRPQSFKEVVGQESIVRTLKNSLKFNKSAQAYLFAGPRGIGKTTLTRLFAKALSCKQLTKEYEPCNICKSCQEITDTSSLDVIEIDGASNRGIDDIRQINDTIGYAPSSGKYKIYIIDEVHMLTKEAFNALLKTLEEPPSTVKFFFATTEPHKVLATIISRCQRYDLKPIAHDLVINKLLEIAKDQDREIDLDALKQIAKFSEGSLRDAESMLDQILCYSEEAVTQEMINQIFGLIPQSYFFDLDNAAKDNDITKALTITDIIYKEGKDYTFFIDHLVDHFRKIIILKLQADVDIFLTDSVKEQYLESAKIYSLDQCLHILDLLMKSYLQIQKTPSKRCFLEMVLIEIIRSNNKIPLQALVQRLSQLEQNIKTTSAPKESNGQPLQPLTPSDNEKKLKAPAKAAGTIPAPLISKNKIIPPLSLPTSQNMISTPPSKKTDKKPKIEKAPLKLEDEKEQILGKTTPHHDTLMNFAAVELEGIIKK